jgi:hypothetical protein
MHVAPAFAADRAPRCGGVRRVHPAGESVVRRPHLKIAQEPPFAPGQTLDVKALAWTGDCNDLNICGCLSCSGGEPARPGTNTVLFLRPVDDTTGKSDIVLLEGLDANEDLRFEVHVTLPDVPKGMYTIVGSFDDGLGGSARFRIRSE